MSYNYNQAKFIIFLTTQFGTGKLLDPRLNTNTAKIQKFIDTGANGFVLMTKDDGSDHYGIDTIKSTTNGVTNMAKCVNDMVAFAKKIKELKTDAKFWIGTPEINSANYATNPASFSTNYTTTTATQIETLVDFLIMVKEEVSSEGLWNSVEGFYYNQESIYGDDFNVDQLIHNCQYYVMASFASYVHENTPARLPISLKNSEVVEIGKELIWIPYFATAGSNIQNADELISNSYIRIANIVERTMIFDCVFIQAFLVSIYGKHTDYPNGYDVEPKKII